MMKYTKNAEPGYGDGEMGGYPNLEEGFQIF